MANELNILNNDSCGSGSGCSSGGCSSGGCSTSPSRRAFLSQATTVMIGSISLTVLPVVFAEEGDGAGAGAAAGPAAAPGAEAVAGPVTFGFMVDTEKCIGAGKCLTACRTENNVPEGQYRTWVERHIQMKDGSVHVDLVPEAGYAMSESPAIDPDLVERAFFVPKLCNQCADAPCNQVCPTHASVTSPEGVELVDPELCIGCAYCVEACPYGVRFINKETNNADKCNWCYHRIMRQEEPACVEACPVNARVFGRLDDPESEIRKRLAQVPTHVLKEHLGTHPKLFYIGITKGVI